ncbi:MAG: hypothetical protein K6B68_07565 [Eubacterium sp.]|nr:hypothetical protein [Eubacterium sp.]
MIRMYQDNIKRKQEENSMIFDERPLDKIIADYKKENEVLNDCRRTITSSHGLEGLGEMYLKYRKQKEPKTEYVDNSSIIIEELKKLRKNT